MSEETAVVESGVLEVSAKKEGFEEVTVQFDFGKNLAELTEKFGEDVVFTNARANMKITLQGVIRRYIAAGKTADEIAEVCANWKPGMQMERTVDPIAAARKAMANMDEDARKAFIEKLLGA